MKYFLFSLVFLFYLSCGDNHSIDIEKITIHFNKHPDLLTLIPSGEASVRASSDSCTIMEEVVLEGIKSQLLTFEVHEYTGPIPTIFYVCDIYWDNGDVDVILGTPAFSNLNGINYQVDTGFVHLIYRECNRVSYGF